MSQTEPAQITVSTTTKPAVPRRRRVRRALGVGCLLVLLSLCSVVGVLGFALRSGPVTLGLPGNSALKLGSDSFVLSNYSFQNGTTYYADFKGSGIRDIVELHLLSDKHSFEIVLHHATKDTEGDNHLLDLPMP